MTRTPLPQSIPLPPSPITGDLTIRYAEAWLRERRNRRGWATAALIGLLCTALLYVFPAIRPSCPTFTSPMQSASPSPR